MFCILLVLNISLSRCQTSFEFLQSKPQSSVTHNHATSRQVTFKEYYTTDFKTEYTVITYVTVTFCTVSGYNKVSPIFTPTPPSPVTTRITNEAPETKSQQYDHYIHVKDTPLSNWRVQLWLCDHYICCGGNATTKVTSLRLGG